MIARAAYPWVVAGLALWIVFTGSLAWVESIELYTDSRIARSAHWQPGTIAALFPGGARTSASVSYDYLVSGVRYTGISNVPKRDIDLYRVGESLRVAYLPDNPAVSRPEFRLRQGRWDSIILGLIGASLGSISMSVLIVRKDEYVRIPEKVW